MRINPTALVGLALVLICAAVITALAGKRSIPRTELPPPAPAEPNRPSRKAIKLADRTIVIARRYALAARNWTPASYRKSWDTQTRLAGGRYLRELISNRPDATELRALERDRAVSRATLVDVQRDVTVRPPAARVFVTLDETTVAGGQAVRGLTLNEVRLTRRAGRWRVTSWTVVPGGQGGLTGS
jgi:hypothetical protein